MKVKITKVSGDKHNISADIELYKNDGTLFWSGTRGFVSLATTSQDVLTELKQSFKNIAQQLQNENASKLKEVVEANLNKEIDIG